MPQCGPPFPEIWAITPPPAPSPLTLALPVALLERARVGKAAAGPIVRGSCRAGGRSPGRPFRTSTRPSPSAQAAPEWRQRETRRRRRRRRQSHEGGRRRRPCGRRASGQYVPHGRLQGKVQRAGVRDRAFPAQSHPTPTLLRAPVLTGGSARSRPGLRSHPVRHAQPNPLLPPRPPPPPPSRPA